MQETAIEGFRLSPQQRRLWSLERQESREASASPYHVRCQVSLEGSLDESALREGLGEVGRRRELLRRGFCSPPGMTLPLQVIGPDYEPLSDRRAPDGTCTQGPECDAGWYLGAA